MATLIKPKTNRENLSKMTCGFFISVNTKKAG